MATSSGKKRSFGEKIMEGLGNVTQNIPEMIYGYNEHKQSKKLAEMLDIPEEHRDDFASMPTEWQKFYATNMQKQKGAEQKRLAAAEKIPKGAAAYLKTFYPSLSEDPKSLREISQLSKQFALEGMPETEAYEAAVRQFKSPKQTEEGSFGNVEEEQKPGDMRDFLGKILTQAQKEPARQHPMTTLEKERPGGTLASLGIGAAAPIEEALRYQSKPARETFEKMGFTYPKGAERGKLVTEKLREKLTEGLSPEAKKASGEAEFAGAFLPAERLLTGLKLIGKSAGFLKNAEKFAAAKGISAEEAIKVIANEAEMAGIDIAKAAAGDRQEAGKLFNLSNRINKSAPETPSGLRMERAKPKEKIFPTEERVKVREEQLKSFPKYEAEIAKDASERAARAEAKIPKTVKGMDAKRLRVHAAEKNLPHAEESYRKSIARTRALEDEIVKHTGAEKERFKDLLEASKNDLKDAEYYLKQTMQNISGGEARVGLEDMRKAAQNKMMKIGDQIAAGEDIKLAKMDYNPQMVHEAKRVSKKKAIPSTKQDDFYQQVHKEYGDQYRKQLERIDKEIKDLPKTMNSAVQIRNLQKEKEIIKKLIEQTEAERTIHRHKLALRETAERQKAKERLSQFQKQQANPKVQKVAQEKIQENIKSYLNSPSEEKAAEIAAQSGIPKEAVKQGKNLVESIKELDQAAKKGTKPSVNKFKEEFDKFRNAIKAKDFKELAQNPYSRGIGQIIADYILNETDLLDTIDLPGGVTALSTVAAGSRGRNPFIRNGVVLLYRLAMNNYKIENYVRAVRSHDDQKVARLKKEYQPKLIKKAQARLSSE